MRLEHDSCGLGPFQLIVEDQDELNLGDRGLEIVIPGVLGSPGDAHGYPTPVLICKDDDGNIVINMFDGKETPSTFVLTNTRKVKSKSSEQKLQPKPNRSKPKQSTNTKSSSSITKEDHAEIIKLVKKGVSSKEIQSRLSRTYPIAQIASVRAWVTMGKY
jgi:hypothetical protein